MKRWLPILFICFVLSCKNGKQHIIKTPFQKIIFHTTGCYGWCPIYHLEVDSNRALKLHAEMVRRSANDYKGDSTKMGYFTGKVPDTTFNKLKNAFQALGIDTLKFNEITCCDGSIKTIIVYYNGKRKVMMSMTPPKASNSLLGLLLTICEQNNLMRSDSTFKIENVNTLKVLDIRYPPKIKSKH